MQEYYTNPTVEGNLRWRCASSCTFDSGEALEGWKNRSHNVSMRRFARVTMSMRWVENESREIPTYEDFKHTLETTPRTWYTSMELRQGTQYCERLAKKFTHTFEFADENPTIETALQMKKRNIVAEIPIREANSHQCSATIQ